MRLTTQTSARLAAFATLAITASILADDASAQFTPRPGVYIGNQNVRVNPWNGSVHAPNRGVVKSDGRVYRPIGGGYYQNPWTGNKYNPSTGAYLHGARPGFSSTEHRQNNYLRFGNGPGVNLSTGSVHLPGQAVHKASGSYQAIGGGYYRNSMTGNTYNPYKGTYIRNW